MVMSITPLGERSRGNRYLLTLSAFLVGTSLGGLTLGSALGFLGSLLPLGGVPALIALAVALSLGALLDLGRLPFPLPTFRRQVDAAWIDTYRGTVYGFGFGLQLGGGVVTVVTSSLVYIWPLAALVSGSVWAGALFGLVFGLGRGIALLPASRVTAGQHFGALWSRMTKWEARTRLATLVAQCCLVAFTVLAIIID